MTAVEFFQILLYNRKWVFYFPLLTGLLVFVLLKRQPASYSSETVIYTGIASGFNPDNDYENKVDYHAVNSRFDNVINIIGSKETRTTAAISLLTYCIKSDTTENMFSDKEALQILRSDDLKNLKGKDSIEVAEYITVQSENRNSYIFKILNGDKLNCFNVKRLSEVKASRLGMSDMLKLEYIAADPLICKKTLDFITEVFLKKYQGIRVGEADKAVQYFREQTAISKKNLQESEERLKRFHAGNGIINYYEQTKYIADQDRTYENDFTNLKMSLEGYKNALAKVESKIDSQILLQIENNNIVDLKKQLSDEIAKSIISGNEEDYRVKIEDKKSKLKSAVQNSYSLQNSVEGLPRKEMLNEWLRLTVEKLEAETKLKVLEKGRIEFKKEIDHFAPLGSEITKLEREVDVAEKEYLNLLHNMNQAVLRERNLQVFETVSVIDEAAFPVNANGNKKIMLVILSVIGTSFASIAILIIKEFADQSIASPIRLMSLTGLETTTAFLKEKKQKAVVLNATNTLSAERWKLNLFNRKPGDKFLLVPFYLKKDSAERILESLNPDQETRGKFIISESFYPEMNYSVINESSKVYLIIDSAQKLDDYKLQLINKWKSSASSLEVIMINMKETEYAKFIGEIPRKRNRLRILFKKLIVRYAS